MYDIRSCKFAHSSEFVCGLITRGTLTHDDSGNRGISQRRGKGGIRDAVDSSQFDVDPVRRCSSRRKMIETNGSLLQKDVGPVLGVSAGALARLEALGRDTLNHIAEAVVVIRTLNVI